MASVIRGSDNFDSLASSGIGVNQTWQNVSGSRSVNVNYTNTSGKPIVVSINGILTSGGSNVVVTVDGLVVAIDDCSNNVWGNVSVVVPAGSIYKLNSAGFSTLNWFELR